MDLGSVMHHHHIIKSCDSMREWTHRAVLARLRVILHQQDQAGSSSQEFVLIKVATAALHELHGCCPDATVTDIKPAQQLLLEHQQAVGRLDQTALQLVDSRRYPLIWPCLQGIADDGEGSQQLLLHLHKAFSCQIWHL